MSKKKYNWEKNKEVGCNKTHGRLLTDEQIAASLAKLPKAE